MKWSDFEHYLKGEHLNGRKVIATVAEIVIEETHAQAGRTEEKPVCYFKESKKGFDPVAHQHARAARHVRRRRECLHRQARPARSRAAARGRSRYVAGAHQSRAAADAAGANHGAGRDHARGRLTETRRGGDPPPRRNPHPGDARMNDLLKQALELAALAQIAQHDKELELAPLMQAYATVSIAQTIAEIGGDLAAIRGSLESIANSQESAAADAERAALQNAWK